MSKRDDIKPLIVAEVKRRAEEEHPRGWSPIRRADIDDLSRAIRKSGTPVSDATVRKACDELEQKDPPLIESHQRARGYSYSYVTPARLKEIRHKRAKWDRREAMINLLIEKGYKTAAYAHGGIGMSDDHMAQLMKAAGVWLKDTPT